MVSKIVVDGREYGSPDDMPPDVRRVYEQVMGRLGDADRDGVPDLLQPLVGSAGVGHTIETTSITVNGKTYGGPDEMPEDVRRLYQAAMAKLAVRGGDPSVVFSKGAGGAPADRTFPDPVADAFPRTLGVTVTAGRPGAGWRIVALIIAAAALAWLATGLLFR